MRLFAVRMIEGQEAVGFFWCEDEFALIDLVDETVEPDQCEYRELTEPSGFAWSAKVPAIGIKRFDVSYDGEPAAAAEYDELTRNLDPVGEIADYFDSDFDEWEPLCAGEKDAREEPGDKVYFIQAGDFIKIGFTKGPMKKRVKDLATAHHERLQVLTIIPDGSVKLEQAIHKRFAALRVRGEWFKVHGDLLTFIEAAKVGRIEL